MALLDDFITALQEYADASNNLYLRRAYGAPGAYIVLNGQRLGTGIAYSTPGFLRGVGTALQAALGYAVATSAAAVVSISAHNRRGALLSWVGPGTLSNITDGYAGMQFTLLFTNGNTTVDQLGNIVLASGVTFVGAPGQALTLLHDGASWREIARAT